MKIKDKLFSAVYYVAILGGGIAMVVGINYVLGFPCYEVEDCQNCKTDFVKVKKNCTGLCK